jgi:hypothetical protein
MFFNITLQRRCLEVCPGCALRNLHSLLIWPEVQLDLCHMEDVFKSTNILGAMSHYIGVFRLQFWHRACLEGLAIIMSRKQIGSESDIFVTR